MQSEGIRNGNSEKSRSKILKKKHIPNSTTSSAVQGTYKLQSFIYLPIGMINICKL